MESIKDFNQSFDTEKESHFTVRIAVTKFEEHVLIDSDEDFFTDDNGLDVCRDLLDNDTTFIDGIDDLPKERGVYECKISYRSWQSNHPLDPVEYDCECSLDSFVKLC